MPLMIWRGFEFSIKTFAYDTLSHSWKANIPLQDRLDSKPDVQTSGQTSETITISGAIFTTNPQMTLEGVPSEEFKKFPKRYQIPNVLRTLGEKLEPGKLTIGGEIMGNWFLKSVQENQSGLLDHGIPKKQTLTLQFQRFYGPLNKSGNQNTTPAF